MKRNGMRNKNCIILNIQYTPLFKALQPLKEKLKNPVLKAFINSCPVFIEDGYVNICEEDKSVEVLVPYPKCAILTFSERSLTNCLEKIASYLYKHYAKEKGWPSKYNVYSELCCAYPKGLFKTNPSFAIEVFISSKKIKDITPILEYYLRIYKQPERKKEILNFLIKEKAIKKNCECLIPFEDIKSMIVARLEYRKSNKCLYCGRTHYKRGKFCSDKCRVYYWRRQKIKEDFKKIKTKKGG